ncbi:hypothetical protein [Nonomuraea aurantiaca]|uniref:hypothetical protein n=1 Tax=Nonomuraea aurantiaca TaxID=2878562 RepID=UPI001CD99AAA|nr:hypothetical protein [Nonomuraea aurantiaca]MCA2223722.1 hypothetical protein [Nonomuraea aurantiaca]
MNQTRKMWASAAVVGVILVGGASVAAAASAGRLQRVDRETKAVVEKEPSVQTDRLSELTVSPAPSDGSVASKELNQDPQKVIEYWTDKRMQDAQPMPMPEVKPGEFTVGE